MLDTLKLNLEEFEVMPGAELVLQPASINAGSGAIAQEYVLWRSNGREVRGVTAWHNSERINITLNPRREAPGTQAVCLVSFSVPKVAHGGNYYPTDHKGTVAALQAVQKHLDDVGIKCNVQRAAIGRLDAAQTMTMREPFAGYAPVLSRLKGKRVQQVQLGTTFRWGNTRWETCAYDKLEELRHLKQSVAGLPPNSLRMELRALKAAKVREMFGFSTVAELLDGLDHVRAVYRGQMESQLFRHELPEDSVLSRADLVEQLKAAQDGSRFWYRSWLETWAMGQIAPQAEALKDAVRLVAPNRITAHRIVRQIEQAEREGMALKKVGPSSRTWGDLYGELRDKVLA